MTFGLQTDEAVSHRILDTATEGGINLLDTADVYPLGGTVETAGRTEEIIGRWLRAKGASRRRDFVLATKAVGKVGPNAWDQGASRKHLLDAIDASLKRLQTDYVDLYQLHHDDRETPLDESLEALDVIVRSGRARYIGVSNFLAYRLARAIGRAELRKLTQLVSVQPRYSLLFREIERELLPLVGEEGLGVIPYNPLAGGLLTGKYQPDAKPRGKHPLHPRRRRQHVPGALLERTQLRHRAAVAPAGRRGRRAARHAGRRLGHGQPADHGAAARRQPSRTARRHAGGRGIQARSGAQAAAGRTDSRISQGRRAALNRTE